MRIALNSHLDPSIETTWKPDPRRHQFKRSDRRAILKILRDFGFVNCTRADVRELCSWSRVGFRPRADGTWSARMVVREGVRFFGIA
jgi:hypothetical protein